MAAAVVWSLRCGRAGRTQFVLVLDRFPVSKETFEMLERTAASFAGQTLLGAAANAAGDPLSNRLTGVAKEVDHGSSCRWLKL